MGLSLTQIVGRKVAGGEGVAIVNCTGEPQTVTVQAIARAAFGSVGFKQGVAFAQIFLNACGALSCVQLNIFEEFSITK